MIEPIDDAAVIAAVDRYRHDDGKPNSMRTARALGMARTTLQARIDRMTRDGRLSKKGAETKPETLVEIRNERFWKSRAQSLGGELADTRHLLAEVAGVMDRMPDPPGWTLPRPTGRRNRAMGLIQISDVHAGEVVNPDEVGGLNEYNLDICRERLRRLFAAAISILPRWASDCKLEGMLIALNGDLISGDIHEELRRTNALTAQQQVFFLADELAAGIEKIADAFGKALVVVTTGNHGRSTLKTNAKSTAALSYDTMIGEQLRRFFARDKRITVNVSPARDAVYDVLGWKVLQTHGDQGGGGGQGFAGPGLPILRKGKSVEYMAAQSRVFYDLILTGHYHSSFNLGKNLANGSVIGWGEFAQSIRASPEPAQQWLALLHEKWGLRERCEIKLQDRLD